MELPEFINKKQACKNMRHETLQLDLQLYLG